MADPIPLVKLSAPAEVVAYACGKCGIVASSVMRDGDAAMDMAVACCAPRVCPCGAALDRTWDKCDACMARESADRLQSRFDAAKKMTIEEWSADESFPEAVFDPHGRAGNDGYCSDLEELRESCIDDDPDDRPTWVWATREVHGLRPDASDVLDHIVQEMHEDAAEDFDAEDLQKRLDAWFAEQKCVTYHEDDKTAVVLDAAFWGDGGEDG